jgi:hypothetical protein
VELEIHLLQNYLNLLRYHHLQQLQQVSSNGSRQYMLFTLNLPCTEHKLLLLLCNFHLFDIRFQEKNVNLNQEMNSKPLAFQAILQTITSYYRYQDRLKSLFWSGFWELCLIDSSTLLPFVGEKTTYSQFIFEFHTYLIN